MIMTAEQIRDYLKQRLHNIEYNLKYCAETPERKIYYGAQRIEIKDILESIR